MPRNVCPKTFEFLQQRISAPILLTQGISAQSLRELIKQSPASPSFELPNVDEIAASLALQPRSFALGDKHQLVLAEVPNSHGKPLTLASLLQGEPEFCVSLVRNAVECWSLHEQNEVAQVALEESAMQLAQSFEEQNWLRGFAKNAACFTDVSSVNEIAQRILQPLVFLLRAQDVFLIALPEETECSGLVSTSYGNSGISVKSIEDLLSSFNFGKNSKPLVRNGMEFEIPECTVHSLVAVSISDAAHRGFLVAVERSQQHHPNGLPVYDAEFGSVEVGLMEEAAVLLTTQTQNMRLLLQSNELFLGTLWAMSSTIDARDPYTQGHSERVARLSYDLAQILGLPDEACHEIYLSGVLHDIGKIGIPDSVLLKPGRLTNEEFEIIKQHPVIGHRIVQRLGHLHFTLPGVLYHHERWDGRGYPHGLQGQAIPLMARIMAVADAFDAMTSSRPYRHAMPMEKAHSIIQAGAAEQWDAEVVQCFNEWVETRYDESLVDKTSNSLIPLEAPMEQLVQAVMTLIN